MALYKPLRVGGPPSRSSKTIFGSEVLQEGFDTGSGVLPNDDPRGEPDGGTRTDQQDQRGYDDAQLLEEVRERLNYAIEADSDNRTRGAEMLRFCYRRGAQWPDKMRRERESDNRPVLEVNQMPGFINQVLNDERQNRPAIKVRPASDDATEELAEIRQDLIRHIEYDSNAGAVYDNTFRYAVAGSIGWHRVVTEYEDETSFNQRLLLKPVPNPLSVYFDPDFIEPDGSDMEWVIVSEELTKDEFRRKYPGAQEVDFQSSDPALTAWLKPNSIRVGDYLHKVRHKEMLYLLATGQTVFQDELDAMDLKPEIVDKRMVDRVEVRWEVVNGIEILEEHQWAGSYIPVIPCFGDMTNVEGEMIRQGLVDRAQDGQQIYNYLVTMAVEAASLQPKAPWLIAEGAIDQRERMWGQANVKNYPYLVYRDKDEQGKPIAPPQRVVPDVDVQGMLMQATKFQQDMRLSIGIADPLAQLETQDVSGRAILAKERIGNTSTFHFVDNLTRCIRLTGKVLLDLIPKIYDTQRVLQLLREDGSRYKQVINQPQPPVLNVMTGQTMPGQTLNPMEQGNYDVIVDVGPSYATKRVEFVNSVMDLTSSNPEIWGLAGDLLVKNMDWPGAEDIAERIRVMLPPPIQQLIADKSNDPEVAGLKAAISQMQQQFQQQTMQMQEGLQKLGMENQQLKSQGFQKDAQVAGLKLQLTQKDMEVAQKNQDAKFALATQMLESQDVHAKIAQEERKAQAEAYKTIQEGIAKQHEAQIESQEVHVKAFSALVDGIAKLGPLMQEGIAMAQQKLPEIEREVAAPAFDPGPLLDKLTGMHQESMGAMTQAMQGMAHGIQGLANQGGQTHALLGVLAKPKEAPQKAGKKVYRIRKAKDGDGYEGEVSEGE